MTFHFLKRGIHTFEIMTNEVVGFRILRIITSLLGFLCSYILMAQDVSVDSVIRIEEVEVKGFRVPDHILSGAPLQTMTRQEMELLGIHDMGDALKRFAGVQVKDYGGLGGIKTINVRGLGAGHTGVSYDGVQVGDMQNGQVDLSRFILDNISSLSLQIGQDDDIFISAKDFTSASIIRINSLSFDNDKNDSPLLQTTIRAGSFGAFAPTLLFNTHLSKTSINAFVGYERADGVYPFSFMNGREKIREHRNNSDIKTWRAEMNGLFRLSPKQTLLWKVYGFTSQRGLPGGVIYDNPRNDERLNDKNGFTQFLYENRLAKKLKFKAIAKWNYSWSDYANLTAGGKIKNTYRQNETYLSTVFWGMVSPVLQLSLTQDFAHNHLSMNLPQAANPTRNALWSAMAGKLNVGNWTTTVSILATNIYEQAKLGDAAKGFHKLSPAFNMQWKLIPTIRLRFGYKDIFRTPNLNELYYTGVGNRRLNSEKSKQWNLGATFKKVFNKLFRVAATVDGYSGRVTDKIVSVPRMFYWQMMNVGKVKMLGLDATFNVEEKWKKNWSFSWTTSYSYLKAQDKTNADDVFYRHQIAYTPLHSGSSSLQITTPWCEINYNILLIGQRYTLGYNIPQNRMEGFTDHNITIGRTFRFAQQKIKTQLDLRNLGNRNYEIVRFYPMPGTNWRMTIQWIL